MTLTSRSPLSLSVPSQDDIDESVASELLAAAPGLFVMHSGTGKLSVTQARDHEKHLEN